MSPRALTATLLLLLTMDTMHARPPPAGYAAAAPNATDDASRLRVRVDDRIAVGANVGAAPRPLLQRLRQMGGGHNGSEPGAAATAFEAASSAPDDEDDSTVRNERSTNLSHITGTSRKIQIYIKNRHLQILPDGTVNGTNDENSDFCEYHFLFIMFWSLILLILIVAQHQFIFRNRNCEILLKYVFICDDFSVIERLIMRQKDYTVFKDLLRFRWG
jgi:hypothetical protein